MEARSKKWSKAEIREMLENSTHAVERGIMAIWRLQTSEEKLAERTKDLNEVGFSAFHVIRGSFYAKWINSGKHLTGKHIGLGRKLILHYVSQLTKISNKEVS